MVAIPKVGMVQTRVTLGWEGGIDPCPKVALSY